MRDSDAARAFFTGLNNMHINYNDNSERFFIKTLPSSQVFTLGIADAVIME
jgi:hypothetical protein